VRIIGLWQQSSSEMKELNINRIYFSVLWACFIYWENLRTIYLFSSSIKVTISFIGGGNQSTRRKQLTCCKSLTNFYHIMLDWLHLAMNGVWTHNFSDDRYWLLR
jgi:hypothetical protein